MDRLFYRDLIEIVERKILEVEEKINRLKIRKQHGDELVFYSNIEMLEEDIKILEDLLSLIFGNENKWYSCFKERNNLK